MGAVSRNVMPVCGTLCFCCPALSTRSRHPIKRYKTLLADIYPRSQDEEPNDRKINKLCEYAARNPLRIPKITTSLEQRCYRELRNERLHYVKVVMCVYRKLLVSCTDQMPLFASSFLSIVHILIDQSRYSEIQILGSQALFEFVNNQRDGTYMFNLDGLIPKLCQVAQEPGEDGKGEPLHAAALQALSSMLWFMGEYSHVSTEFDNIVSVVLENYEDLKKKSSPEEAGAEAGTYDTDSREAVTRLPSWNEIVNAKGQANVSMEDSKNPSFWSRVCLNNMAKLAKEATTVRRVLESLFRYFDNSDMWSPECGLALAVLLDMQFLIEKTGQNTHFLLSTLIKHLDHKNVLKKPEMQLDIVNIAISLAQQTKTQSSVAIIGALSDMIRHLRKSIHCQLDDSNLGAEVIEWNKKFHAAVDDCLVQLCQKVGDAGPVLDVLAVMLENMTDITVMARTLISAVFRAAQIAASLPNLTYQNKAFPEALFHQLLVAMVCADHQTRVGAHRIFSIVLVPTSVCPRPRDDSSRTNTVDIQRTLSRNVSVFSSSAALFEKLSKERNGNVDENTPKMSKKPSVMKRLTSSYSRAKSIKRQGSQKIDYEKVENPAATEQAKSLRLSSHQVSLLLSSIWAQCVSPLNTPQNYEAIAHTFSLVLLFARTKNSSYEILSRSFQLAFSLRDISLNGEGQLPVSCRRSLFFVATFMIIFLSKTFNILPLVHSVKAALTDETVDPFLVLVDDDCKLQAIVGPEKPKKDYGSKEDEQDAVKSLSAVEITECQSKASSAEMIVKFLGKSTEDSSIIKNQLLSDFALDDACPLGSQIFNETPEKSYESERKEKAEPSLISLDDDAGDGSSPSASKSQEHPDSKSALETSNLLSISELLDSVLETTPQDERTEASAHSGLSYEEMAGNCEAVLMGKQQKMSTFMNHQQTKDGVTSISVHDDEAKSHLPTELGLSMHGNPFLDQGLLALTNDPVGNGPLACAAEYQRHPHPFALPASSPYDNFLKAAGC